MVDDVHRRVGCPSGVTIHMGKSQFRDLIRDAGFAVPRPVLEGAEESMREDQLPCVIGIAHAKWGNECSFSVFYTKRDN